jgi:large subunit ribosomal protein L11
MEFCKAFNAATQKLEQGMPIPVLITVFKDKSFVFETRSPPVSFFIKKTLKLKKASQTPGKEVIASISKNDIKKIAEEKMNDLNTNNLESAEKMVAGTARSMGIKVE